MKFILFVLTTLSILVFGSFQALADALIDPALSTFAGTMSGTQATQRVLILTKGVSPNEKPNRYDRNGVIRYYQEASRLSLMPLMTSLQNNQLPGVKVLATYWINGAVLADVTRDGLMNLSKHAVVTKIYSNRKSLLDLPINFRLASGGRRAEDVSADYHFASIGLDKLMKEQPQVLGTGVTVGLVDTGVDSSHPALLGKVPLFYNGVTRAPSQAKDFDQHGTHVSGTVAGGNRTNNLIGVAPGAKIVMAGVVEQGYDAMLAGMQFFIDQRQNPVANTIKVVGCSWNSGGAPDQELFYRAIAAWEAAGILPVFSAGNAGRQGITPPHEYPGTFAIAAFGADGKIADFSSVGPGHYHNQTTQKPDIAAPGVDITSSIPNGGYASMSGTSMAQPHVTGTVALLLQLKPDLNPAQLKVLLSKSAVAPQGQTPGSWDPSYGFGRLNAYNAVKAVMQFMTVENRFATNSVMNFMTTPEDLEFQEIKNASLGEVGGTLDQFHGSVTDRWMTSVDAFN